MVLTIVNELLLPEFVFKGLLKYYEKNSLPSPIQEAKVQSHNNSQGTIGF